MKTWVILSDIQIPFQDKYVLEDLVLKFIKDLKPHGVCLNGDIADCYLLSDFSKDPASEADLKLEIKEVGELMDFLAKYSKERVYLGGNHEDRLRRHAWKQVPALAETGYMDFSKVFRTKEHGFDYKPYGASLQLGHLMVTHGDLVSKHSAYTAKMTFDKVGSSVLVGHTHRLGAYYRTDVHGVHAAYENGCLCRMDPEYVQRPNWQTGFSVVHVEDKGNMFSVQQIPVLGRKCFYYGRDRIGRL